MRTNTAKAKIKAGQTAVGVFCNIGAPALVEVLGHLGFDFVILDAEHGPFDVEGCEAMVRAADAVGIVPIIRVAQNVQQVILRYLDIGALGVQLPMITTRADAEAVVRAVKYPPQGRRGLASVRANDYGLRGSLAEYVKRANEETLVVTHVETLEAAGHLDEMLQVPGVDVIFIGPTDLSSSMGHPGDFNHPQVQAKIGELAQRIRAGGKAAGTVAYTPEAVRQAKERGFQYIAAGVVSLLTSGGRDYLRLCQEVGLRP